MSNHPTTPQSTTTPVYTITVARDRPGATLVYYAVARERVAAILAGSAGPVLSVERFGA